MKMRNMKIWISILVVVTPWASGCSTHPLNGSPTADSQPTPVVAVSPVPAIEWHSIERTSPASPFEVDGLPWLNHNPPEFRFGRLPVELKPFLEKTNPDAWSESLCPSGARVRFATDSGTIRIRVLHGHERIALYHMASTGVAGFDLYEGGPVKPIYRGTSKPVSGTAPYEHTLFQAAPTESGKLREWTLYLPAYARLASLEIGVDPGSKLTVPSPFLRAKPIVFYGTSITQSGCASRGSNGYVPLLGRMLGVDVVNLGLSGAGRSEPEVAQAIADAVDASVFVVDSIANMNPETMKTHYGSFVAALRRAHPKTPIVLLTRIHFADVEATWGESMRDTPEKYAALHAELFRTYQRHRDAGDRNIFIFDMGKAIGRPNGDHPTVDGVHPTDLGFRIMAEKLRPVLAPLVYRSR
jgi:lysophospholipase L1-like esterase